MSQPVPAVLFLIFNRPDTTRVVFEAIRKAKPAQLFVAADGPRPHKPGEADQSELTRKIIQYVDWDCEVKTLFRTENLGCKTAIRTSLDWFFDHVEAGIILEDDCLPDESFFGFCSLMLDKYKKEDRVKMVAGTNFLYGRKDAMNGYYFSTFMPVWGWATWRRAWKEVVFEADGWEQFKNSAAFKERYPHKKFTAWLINLFESVFNGKVNAWSPYMLYSFARLNGLTVSPYRNLISNIGYAGENMGSLKNTHPFFNMPVVSLQLDSMKMKNDLHVDRATDKITFTNVARIEWKKSLAERIWLRLKRELKFT